MTTKPRTPKPGDPVRFEGDLYVYSGPEEGCAPGWVAFHRPPSKGKGETRYRRARCELKDLTWSESNQAFYLPGRGLWVHDPKTPPIVQRHLEGALGKGDDPEKLAALLAAAAKKKLPYRKPIFIEDGLPPEMVDRQIRAYIGEG